MYKIIPYLLDSYSKRLSNIIFAVIDQVMGGLEFLSKMNARGAKTIVAKAIRYTMNV